MTGAGRRPGKGPVAFFFLGETLLIPHLYPVVEALAKHSGIDIDLWVSTSVHEKLLADWSAGLGPAYIRIRRAPAFRKLSGYEDGRNPPLPPKWRILAGMVPRLVGTPVVVSVEQTSLWIPALAPFLGTRFINIMHGSGTMNSRDDFRRRKAWRMPVPSESEQREFLQRGYAASYVPVVGSVKATFRNSTRRQLQFPQPRPIVMYNPHWQRHRSSWWDWGRGIVQRLVEQDRYNVILAPHQRLVEGDPELARILGQAAQHPHVHSDIDSFAMVDGSYPAAADIYLGDTSSQVIEFMARPRPCVFLDNKGVAEWQQRPAYEMWQAGEVVTTLDEALPALHRARARHAEFTSAQQQIVQRWLGATTGAPERIVEHILEALGNQPPTT